VVQHSLCKNTSNAYSLQFPHMYIRNNSCLQKAKHCVIKLQEEKYVLIK